MIDSTIWRFSVLEQMPHEGRPDRVASRLEKEAISERTRHKPSAADQEKHKEISHVAEIKDCDILMRGRPLANVIKAPPRRSLAAASRAGPAICSNRRRNLGRRCAFQRIPLERVQSSRASEIHIPPWRRLLPASAERRRRIVVRTDRP